MELLHHKNSCTDSLRWWLYESLLGWKAGNYRFSTHSKKFKLSLSLSNNPKCSSSSLLFFLIKFFFDMFFLEWVEKRRSIAFLNQLLVESTLIAQILINAYHERTILINSEYSKVLGSWNRCSLGMDSDWMDWKWMKETVDEQIKLHRRPNSYPRWFGCRAVFDCYYDGTWMVQ